MYRAHQAHLISYHLAVADGALRGVASRPMVLKRFVNRAEGEFFQKRAPKSPPEWIQTVELSFPSGRTACAPRGEGGIASISW